MVGGSHPGAHRKSGTGGLQLEDSRIAGTIPRMSWRQTRLLLVVLIVLALLALYLFVFPRPAATQAPARVLLVTATAGFYHQSIPTIREVVQRLGAESGELSVTLASDAVGLALIRPETPASPDVV